jgi:hypothetical protein
MPSNLSAVGGPFAHVVSRAAIGAISLTSALPSHAADARGPLDRFGPCATIHTVLPLLGSAVAFLSLFLVYAVVAGHI